MTRLSFFDTNVLLYAEDIGELTKQARAEALVKQHVTDDTFVVSLQVLQEYFSAGTRKMRMPVDAARAKLSVLAATKVVRLDAPDILAAIDLHQERQISFWDALIVRAAQVSGAKVLFTEDLQHGALFGSVTVVNPFLE